MYLQGQPWCFYSNANDNSQCSANAPRLDCGKREEASAVDKFHGYSIDLQVDLAPLKVSVRAMDVAGLQIRFAIKQ